uniref:L-glutamate gamma-semialdehyde dehydrogenase n=1 Tax=candidate division WOR-3 bacterium TaxID=2052148 RepID=A0A7V4E3R0_UNCW3
MLPPFKNEAYLDFSIEKNKKEMEEALKKVKREASKEYPLIINGKKVFKKEKFKSINPAHPDEILGFFSKAEKEDIDKAIESGLKVFEKFSSLPKEERASILLRAANIMRRKRLELAATIILEVGKNWLEADADVCEAIDFLEFYAREILRYQGEQELTPFLGEFNELRYLPLGVGAVIPPWNFPLAILTGMTSAAIVCGNPVILKPASDAPLIAYKFCEIMMEAGLPEGVLNFITGSGTEIGDYLVSHPKIRFIAFTGSKDVGLRINELASKIQKGQIWIKRVIAEMGGKDAIIVDNEIEELWEEALNGVLASAYGFSGQKCSACSRLILHKDIYERFLEDLKEKVKNIKIGPTEIYENYLGPVINENAYNKILNYIEIGKREGKLFYGGKGLKEELFGYFIEPTIFIDVPYDAKIAQEEIFGPVLSVIKANDFEEALFFANATEYGLTGSVYTKNRYKIKEAKDKFFVGNLYINRKCTGALVGVHPFGGFNMSGTDSKAGGRDYLLLFLQAKSISEKL